ncbi:unnamed protein product, partial [Ectocarpus sp. 12 AP-2014]
VLVLVSGRQRRSIRPAPHRSRPLLPVSYGCRRLAQAFSRRYSSMLPWRFVFVVSRARGLTVFGGGGGGGGGGGPGTGSGSLPALSARLCRRWVYSVTFLGGGGGSGGGDSSRGCFRSFGYSRRRRHRRRRSCLGLADLRLGPLAFPSLGVLTRV